MDAKEKQLFTAMWSLLRKYQELMGDVLPVVHEISTTLAENDPRPSPEQLRTWKARYDEMSQRYDQITGLFESVRQIADPLFGYDA